MNGLQAFIVTTFSKTHTYTLRKLKGSAEDHTRLHHQALSPETGKWPLPLRVSTSSGITPLGHTSHFWGYKGKGVPTFSSSWPTLRSDAESGPRQAVTTHLRDCLATLLSLLLLSFFSISRTASLHLLSS